MDECETERSSGGMRYKQAAHFPHEPPLVCSDGHIEWDANRKRKQGFGSYKDYDHPALCKNYGRKVGQGFFFIGKQDKRKYADCVIQMYELCKGMS